MFDHSYRLLVHMFCSVVKKVKIQDRCVRGVKIQDFILLARIVDVFQKLMISLLSTPHPLNWKIFKIGINQIGITYSSSVLSLVPNSISIIVAYYTIKGTAVYSPCWKIFLTKIITVLLTKQFEICWPWLCSFDIQADPLELLRSCLLPGAASLQLSWIYDMIMVGWDEITNKHLQSELSIFHNKYPIINQIAVAFCLVLYVPGFCGELQGHWLTFRWARPVFLCRVASGTLLGE